MIKLQGDEEEFDDTVFVVPPEQAQEMAPKAEPEPEEPKERLTVQAARMILSLAVVAGLALLVYWLLGQSQ